MRGVFHTSKTNYEAKSSVYSVTRGSELVIFIAERHNGNDYVMRRNCSLSLRTASRCSTCYGNSLYERIGCIMSSIDVQRHSEFVFVGRLASMRGVMAPTYLQERVSGDNLL